MKNAIRGLSLLVAIAVSGSAQAGFATGNGGDYIRGTFIKMGKAVVSYLKETDAGMALTSKANLNVDTLDATLSIDAISVEAQKLVDNGGSDVDAIGVVGKITLNHDRWIDHFEKERDVYYLVFHEMLRSAGVNDDHYVISAALNPFPVARKVVTRTTTRYPLMGDDNLSKIFTATQVQLAGTGCPSGLDGTFVDFDDERNQMEITFDRFNLKQQGLDRKACALSLPFSVPAGKRLVISQLDMAAKVELAPSSQVQFGIEAFVTGTKGLKETKSAIATTDPVVGSVLVRKSDILKTACKPAAPTAGILRLNSAGMLQNASTLPSVGKVSRISISLRLESCK